MRVAIVYNQPRPFVPEGHWLCRSQRGTGAALEDRSETSVRGQVADIERALRDIGVQPVVCGVESGAGLVDVLVRERPRVVFNCCESLHGNSRLEMSVAALFDLLGVAYTGSPALTLGLALDKGLAKALFQAHGVRTPASVVVQSAADLAGTEALPFPVIVKPVAEDASIGIDNDAVVHDARALAQRVAFVRDELHQPAIVEEFIDGRELNVGLLAGARGELEPLPVSEVTFEGLSPGVPAIVSYHAKWTADSPDYLATPVTCPARLEPALADEAQALALSAARAVGVRDYGRVDIRMRADDGALFVLEVNPNPDLSADAGFMRAARAGGGTFTTTVARILAQAAERAGELVPAVHQP